MNLCSCSCTRTGRRSAITHSDSVFGSSTPCTGENRIAAARDASCRALDDIARELVVRAIGDDELHLVVRRETVEVGPVVLVGFAAAGTLDVDDLHDARRHAIDRPVPAGFEQHRVAGREQPIHQLVHAFLQQRLAAGDFDERAPVAPRPPTSHRRPTSCGLRERRTACRTRSSADRTRSAGRRRSGRRRASIRPGSNGRFR